MTQPDLSTASSRRVAAEHAAAELIARAATEENTVERVLGAVCVPLQLQWAGYWRVDKARGVLACEATFQDRSLETDRFTQFSYDATFAPGDDLPGRIWSSAASVWVEAVERADSARAEAGNDAGLVTGFGCPITVDGQIAGVLEFYAARALERDAELLASVASVGSQIGQFAARRRTERDLSEREATHRALLVDRTAELDTAVEQLRARTEESAVARAEAEAARAEADQANRAKGDFLSIISHELRTPLNAIIGYTDLLLSGIPDQLPEPVRGYVDRVHGAAQHLLLLIEEVLSFSRIEAGGETVDVQPVDVTELVRDVARSAESLASRKGLTLRVTLPDQARIESDPAKVRQILMNLVSNAVKFTEQGGIEIGAEHTNGGMLLRVRDTGIGIEAEHLAHIFEPFWQAETATTRRQGGTGLGLSVSRRLARMLGGDIAVESEPGRGTMFTVLLPREVPAAGRAAGSADGA